MFDRVPISGIERFWESSNSRLMMYLFHPFGTGVHLTPGGTCSWLVGFLLPVCCVGHENMETQPFLVLS